MDFLVFILLGLVPYCCQHVTSQQIVVGLTGGTGSRGPVGFTGSPGRRGPMGPPGLVGPRGASGPQGGGGPAGMRGSQGDTGSTGSSGLVGPRGSAGQPGPRGVPAGFIGNTGATGPSGNTGAAGRRGPNGLPGLSYDGTTDEFGRTGATGLFGRAGPAGRVGEMGQPGEQGPTGPTGNVGPPGAAGPPGELIFCSQDHPEACDPEQTQGMEQMYKKWDQPWARHLLNPYLLAAMLSWFILLTIGIIITVITGLCCLDDKTDATASVLPLATLNGNVVAAPAYTESGKDNSYNDILDNNHTESKVYQEM